MKDFLTLMADLGFRKISANNYYANHGDVYYIVSLLKDKHGDASVYLSVEYSKFFTKFEKSNFHRDTTYSVWGAVGYYGVGDNGMTISKDAFDFSLIESTIVGFFSQFRSLKDLANGNDLAKYMVKSQPANFKEAIPDTPPRFTIKGDLLSHDDARRKIGEKLDSCLQKGSKLSKIEGIENRELVRVQKRNRSQSMYDCFSILLDKYSTFVMIQFYPWSNVFTSIRDEWHGDAMPFLPYYVYDGGKLKIFPTDEFLSLSCKDIRTHVADGFSLLEDVHDEAEYVEKLRDSDWAFLYPEFTRAVLVS